MCDLDRELTNCHDPVGNINHSLYSLVCRRGSTCLIMQAERWPQKKIGLSPNRQRSGSDQVNTFFNRMYNESVNIFFDGCMVFEMFNMQVLAYSLPCADLEKKTVTTLMSVL